MIQDIKPNIYRNEYTCQEINDNDTVVFVNSDCVLIKEGEKLEYPKYSQVKDRNIEFTYLFSIIISELGFILKLGESVCAPIILKPSSSISPLPIWNAIMAESFFFT